MPTASKRCHSALQELHGSLHPGAEAVPCRSCTGHGTEAVRNYTASFPMYTTLRQCGSVLQESHYRLLPGNEAGHCRSSATPARRLCCSASHEFHCPLRLVNVAVHCRSSDLLAGTASWG